MHGQQNIKIQKYTEEIQLRYVTVKGFDIQNYNCLIKYIYLIKKKKALQRFGSKDVRTGNKCLHGIRTGNTYNVRARVKIIPVKCHIN